MKYKVHVENLTDATDFFDMDADAVMVFVAKFKVEKAELEHGMGFAGNKKIMAEVINVIPYQIKSLMEEERRAQQTNSQPKTSNIILPNDKKGLVKN